jgi:hypothetical protein
MDYFPRSMPFQKELKTLGGQGLISPMFYEQLSRLQIPKVQKDSQVISVFLYF